jgi:hypothetical protein
MLRIDPEIISKIYEDYISRRKGEKGKFLEEKALKVQIRASEEEQKPALLRHRRYSLCHPSYEKRK